MATNNTLDNWLSSWPDAVAFVAVLAVAWWAGWNAGDLVWSLWLSSLVVGYSTIVWMIGQPAVEYLEETSRDHPNAAIRSRAKSELAGNRIGHLIDYIQYLAYGQLQIRSYADSPLHMNVP